MALDMLWRAGCQGLICSQFSVQTFGHMEAPKHQPGAVKRFPPAWVHWWGRIAGVLQAAEARAWKGFTEKTPCCSPLLSNLCDSGGTKCNSLLRVEAAWYLTSHNWASLFGGVLPPWPLDNLLAILRVWTRPSLRILSALRVFFFLLKLKCWVFSPTW